MIDHIVTLTLKPITFLASTGYLMFAELPMDIPIPVDKGIALSLAVWALIATKRELEKTRRDFKQELKEERSRSDAHPESLNKLADGLRDVSSAVSSCPLKHKHQQDQD